MADNDMLASAPQLFVRFSPSRDVVLVPGPRLDIPRLMAALPAWGVGPGGSVERQAAVVVDAPGFVALTVNDVCVGYLPAPVPGTVVEQAARIGASRSVPVISVSIFGGAQIRAVAHLGRGAETKASSSGGGLGIFGGKRIRELEEQYAEAQRQIQETAARNAQLEDRVAKFQEFFDSHGGQELWDQDVLLEQAREQLGAHEADLAEIQERIRREENEATQHIADTIKRLEEEERDLQEKLHPMRVQVLDEQAALEDYDHPAKDSIALSMELGNIRKRIQGIVRTQTAVSSLEATVLPTTKAGRSKLAKDTAKLALRAFNAEVQNVITSATATNYEAGVAKIQRAADAVAKLGDSSGVEINPGYVELRMRELKLAVDHLKTKKIEREIEREHKAELREQAKVEREMQAEQDRLEKEKRHYLNVLKVVREAGDEAEAARLQEQLVSIEKGLNDVEERRANARAGYVYVISNIGAFGERMVKIGMTRRLDPMDRVKELGDASVPFGFDVHALFFSEDAVALETDLHHRFADRRVNRINTRREFFYATPAEVRDVLEDVAGNLVEFTEEAEAEQYRLSLQMAADEAAD